MRYDLRITREGGIIHRPSRRPFWTSVVMPICLRIGVLMGRWWDNLFFQPVVPGSRCQCQCMPLHLLLCQCVPVCSVCARVRGYCAAWIRSALHLLVLSKPDTATCLSRRQLNDHQHGKTGLQRLRAKPVSKKAGKVSQ